MTKKEKETVKTIIESLKQIQRNAEGCYETSNIPNFNWIAEDVVKIKTQLSKMLNGNLKHYL